MKKPKFTDTKINDFSLARENKPRRYPRSYVPTREEVKEKLLPGLLKIMDEGKKSPGEKP